MKAVLLEMRQAARAAAVTFFERVNPPRINGYPLPPPKLRDKVVKGLVTASEFLREGEAVAAQIRAILDEVNAPLLPGQRVYEWGAGCGRVTRHLIPLGLDVHGSDVDPELVEWCRRNIDPDRYFLNGYTPPLKFADGIFDAVYSISVMTHITMEAADAWIAELARVTKPNGRIIVSLLAEDGTPGGYRMATRHDVGIKRSWLGVAGAPKEYLNVWHDIPWLVDRWSPIVRMEARKRLAIRRTQDLLIFSPAAR